MVSLFAMLFLETLPMAWKLRETTFLQAEEYEPAPCRPEAGQCAATYRGQISPQSQTQLKEKAEGLEERNVGLARGSLSPSSAIRKSKPEKP